MAVVLRLQGLNDEAGIDDIRRFFHGLPISEVHIIGGKTGEAFIIFKTERAGQLAMLCSGKQLRGSTVTLCKISMDEFNNKMTFEWKRKYDSMVNEPVPQITTATECCTALVLSLVGAFQGQQSNTQMNQVRSPPVSTPQITNTPDSGKDAIEERRVPDQTLPVNNQGRVSETARHHVEEQKGDVREVRICKPGYLRLYGLPEMITKEEVIWFLEGLNVMDVITDTLQGPDKCCLVKMASFKEAEEALKYSPRSPKDLDIKVRLAHERMWENATEHRENSQCSTFSEWYRFSPERHLHKNAPVKRPCSHWGSPKRHRSNSPSFDTEYCVMVKNLPKTITENGIRRLFSCPDIPNSKILHPLNKFNEQTSTVFIIFTKPEEYTLAMNMNGNVVGSQIIDVSSITKQKLKDLMRQSRFTESESSRTCSTQAQPGRSCIYARNFPAAVKKAEVMDFFSVHKISDKDIMLLEDSNGDGIGEAVIQFGCEKRAREAHGLHRRHFGREQILLTCISPQQMKDILAKNQ